MRYENGAQVSRSFVSRVHPDIKEKFARAEGINGQEFKPTASETGSSMFRLTHFQFETQNKRVQPVCDSDQISLDMSTKGKIRRPTADQQGKFLLIILQHVECYAKLAPGHLSDVTSKNLKAAVRAYSSHSVRHDRKRIIHLGYEIPSISAARWR